MEFRIQHCGLHCGQNGLLTNVRYADDLMLYARSDTDLASMMECLVEELAAVGSNLVRLAVRLRFFDRVITPVALFASGHRTIRMSDLYKLDVVFRKMLRMIVGPPSFVEWNAPWHEILHHWNGKAVALAQQHGLNPWSEQCLKYHWKFAMHVANLPSNRWVKRVLLWNPSGARTRGYPRHDWTSKLVAYTRFHQLGEWLSLAQDPALWMQLNDDFVTFCSTS